MSKKCEVQFTFTYDIENETSYTILNIKIFGKADPLIFVGYCQYD